MHAGESTVYQMSPYDAPVKYHVKNGVITAIECDDMINTNIAMEDKYIPASALPGWLGTVESSSKRSRI